MTREEFLKEFSERARDYQPGPEVLRHIGDVALCMIIGPSGVGKTNLIQHSGLHFVPSDTTRKIRPEEKGGVDMHFRTDYSTVMEQMKTGYFVQVAVGAEGDLYATKDSSYPEMGWAIMPVMADVIPIFRKLGFKKTVSAFITPPSYEEWMRRLSVHPISKEQLTKRLIEARRSFEFALSDEEVHFILNDQVEAAVKQLKNLVKGQINEEREVKARQVTESLLAALP
jgi:guanylate kinase